MNLDFITGLIGLNMVRSHSVIVWTAVLWSGVKIRSLLRRSNHVGYN